MVAAQNFRHHRVPLAKPRRMMDIHYTFCLEKVKIKVDAKVKVRLSPPQATASSRA